MAALTTGGVNLIELCNEGGHEDPSASLLGCQRNWLHTLGIPQGNRQVISPLALPHHALDLNPSCRRKGVGGTEEAVGGLADLNASCIY